MRSFEIGVVLPLNQSGADRVTPRWSVIREMALRAEAIGFDTVWTPDELLWRPKDRPLMEPGKGSRWPVPWPPRRYGSRSGRG